ncbi:MAG: NAD(P)/FAD-dependent oxidoreductase [Pseudodonghicola sp.]
MEAEGIAIVGAGQAGAALAARLRHKGYDGAISIYGAEPAAPYQRPPLSKKYLGSDWGAERLQLRPAGFWRDNEIELCLGAPVAMIDPELGHLIWNGELRRWNKLALTTGTAPRPLPPELAGRANAYELRTIADVDRLRPAFQPGRRLVVIGGGYIGLESAAVAARAGLTVTLIERAPRILERVACTETAEAIRHLHRSHGVEIREGRGIAAIHGAGRIDAIELDDGSRIDCDLAIVGIGVTPQTGLAAAAGLRCDNGILVDGFGRTSAPGVWAAGDCASFTLDGQVTRLESVQNAIDQAEAVADDMLGMGAPYRPVPWFWSDQFDAKLQIVGLNRGYDRVVTHDGARGQSIWYFRHDRLLAVDAINDPRAYMTAKKLLEAGRTVTPAEIDRPDFEPMQLLRG